MGVPVRTFPERPPGTSGSADAEGTDLPRLAEAVLRRYGYDLRHFAGPYLRRRLEVAMRWEEIRAPSGFRDRLLTDPRLMERLLTSLSGGSRSMFKDAEFLLFLRKEIVPFLRTYPFIRIWLPGCGDGTGAYALAILLTEEGLYDRCRIYVTDLTNESLRKAREGAYPEATVRKWAAAHAAAGGKVPLPQYLVGERGMAAFLPELRRNMVFAQHNPATDASFNEFNLILCRNVLSTLDAPVRNRVHGLLHQSLAMFGYLALGSRETPGGGEAAGLYREVDSRHRIYRKLA